MELSKPIKGLATRLSLNTRNKRHFASIWPFTAAQLLVIGLAIEP